MEKLIFLLSEIFLNIFDDFQNLVSARDLQIRFYHFLKWDGSICWDE